MKFEKISESRYKEDVKNFSEKNDIHNLFNLEDIPLPKRATTGSAGYDFIIPFDLNIKPRQRTMLIPTGIKCQLDNGYVLLLFVRSSVGIKKGVVLSNGTGVVDSDYYFADNEGHIQISLMNNTSETVCLKAGDRIAQGVIVPFGITEDDQTNNNRTGGFGSTN